MKRLLLKTLIPEKDVDFLNSTSIYFYFPNDSKNDSGWCDASTGARILSPIDSVMFVVGNSEEELTLRLRYGNRINDAN